MKSKKIRKVNESEINNTASYLEKHELNADSLYWHCPIDNLQFDTTNDVDSLDSIIGQSRAIEAIKIGAGLPAKGYNIFVTGISGTGRLTTVKRMLEKVNVSSPETFDFCYVNNFTNHDCPILIKLKKSEGKLLSLDMEDTVSFLRRRLPKLFEDDSFQNSRRRIIEEFQRKEKDILGEFDERIKPHGFIRGQLENEQGMLQPEVFPIIEGKPVNITDVDQMVIDKKIPYEKANELKKVYEIFHGEIYELARKGMKMMQEFRKALSENDKANASIIVYSVFDELKDKYNNKKLDLYLDDAKKYVMDNLGLFFNVQQQNQQTGYEQEQEDDRFNLFKVNVILDNSDTVCAPIVIETTPSYTNLFGTIERVYDNRGFWRSDFTKIKAGSLLKADQGFLIVNALDLFTEQGVWTALKRVLLYDKLEIQPFDTYFQLSQSHLKPEPINVKVKVIIIGGQTLYQMLYMYEKGFKKIFKINAQFDYETARTDEMIINYSKFISKVCREENLPHCSPSGVAAIVEWAVAKSGNQKRITLKLSDVADVLREAAFYDGSSENKVIDRDDVEKALEKRRYRNELLDEKLKNHIIEGSLLIDTEGSRIGQINGLTVFSNGILSFGKPVRITAAIGAGSAGIINIEREADLSGSIHNKGMLIISGFLRERFAQKYPLSLIASIAFEQSYGGIDGDSASAAEIYVILSALSEIPINQFFAVTGSVNQKGDIQPIGGVNEKIRGYFEICSERGLNGKHSVIIPSQNVKDLMLPGYIRKAVSEGMFHVYAISRIEEGAELLMNTPAGELDAEGSYPADTIFGRVAERLEKFYKLAKGAKNTVNTVYRKQIVKPKDDREIEE